MANTALIPQPAMWYLVLSKNSVIERFILREDWVENETSYKRWHYFVGVWGRVRGVLVLAVKNWPVYVCRSK